MNRNIAIDGPAGAGKSTIARRLAEQLGYIYVDTGAIYRTVGLYAMKNGVSKDDTSGIINLLPGISIELCYQDGQQRMLLNGEDVSTAIRTQEVAGYASKVAAIPEIRQFLLDMQRDLAAKQDVIMDGRDIGTVVLPDAGLKIYLTASSKVRAHRRWLELQEKGSTQSFEQTLEEVEARDLADMNRAIAPLCQAEDAILVDTSALTLEESITALHTLAEKRFSAASEG